VARFYREHDNPEMIHADLPHVYPHHCEQCGVPYSVNGYAQRGGARAPKYCSPKCKQAAYRARGKAAQEQAERRYQSETARQHAEEFGRARQRAQEEYERQQRDRNQQRQQQGQRQRRAPTGTTRMTWERACETLGLERNFTTEQLRKHYQKMAKQYHPDLNHAPEATARMQEINAAYEYLKR
jgi:hypothetical protein